MKYQANYAASRWQMYDQKSRRQKGVRILKTFVYHLGKQKTTNLKVLDVGASTGIIDNEIAKCVGQLIGIDIDKGAISHATKTFKRKNLQFKVGDAMKLAFKDSSFDAVICTHVYEHVPDSQKLFDEIYRVLKPGGICYLAAMNSLFPWEPHHNLLFLSWLPKSVADFYLRMFRNKDEYYEHPKTYWELKKMLSKFRIYDYTSQIVKSPKKFGYQDLFPKASLKSKLVALFSPLATYFSATFFWILEKK